MKIILLVFLLCIPIVYGAEYSLPLLAVKETKKGLEGSTAELYLEMQKGSGRVFLDTYPLTKLDTQLSTRFAKEIACSYSDSDCNNYDFIYTIKSNSIIIGGPSAGAAISILTIAALENLKLNKNIAITGTINSGNIIGTVGGIKEKIEAASNVGIKTVLIPHGESMATMENITERNNLNKSLKNITPIDLIKYGNEIGVEVIEVFTVDEALFYITGKKIEKNNRSLNIDKTYIETMKTVTESLCKKSKKFQEDLSKINLDEEDNKIYESAVNLTNRHVTAIENEKYYSAASYCFGANTQFSYLYIKSKNLSNEQMIESALKTKSKIKEINRLIDKKELKTITDLETYMIVKERLIEAEDNIDKVVDAENKSDKIRYLSYGMERLNSAVSWANFFDKGKKEFVINKEEIKKSCINKISEAEERYEYLSLLSQRNLASTEQEINLAKIDLQNGDYELCLFKASKAKANSDVILSVIGIEESRLNEVNDKKLEIIKDNIIKSQDKGIFPVIGYSYYEYSNDLKERDIFSSILFTEYSLELSNLDIYFKEDKKIAYNIANFKEYININLTLGFILVFISGILIGRSMRKQKKRKKR